MLSTTLKNTFSSISRFARLERNLAALCLFTPAILIALDDEPVRGSISAYYDMPHYQVYHVIFTMAAMLFVVNGVVKERHWYNTILGILLALVLLFPCGEFPK
ncbi:MAG: hypothetical protein OEY51_10825, partial [Cyclobacteriaceae bacterium]|nr:hypothetical protein [Cyclobacteriaceae bacterium]